MVIGRLSGRRTQAGLDSPVSYTPVPVGSESNNKISAHLKGIDNALGTIIISGTPGGSTTHVQYNNAGAFAGDSNFTYVAGTSTLLINGHIGIPGDVTTARDFFIGKFTTDITNNPGFTVQSFTDGNVYIDFKTTTTGKAVVFRSGYGAQVGSTSPWLRYQADNGHLLLGIDNITDNGYYFQMRAHTGDTYLCLDTSLTSDISGIVFKSGGIQRWVMQVPASSGDWIMGNGSTRFYFTNWGALGVGGVTPTVSLHVYYVSNTNTYIQLDSWSGRYGIFNFAQSGAIKFQIGRTPLNALYMYSTVAAKYCWWIAPGTNNTHFGNARDGVEQLSVEDTFAFYQQAAANVGTAGWSKLHAQTNGHLYYRNGVNSPIQLDGFFTEITQFTPDDTTPTTNVAVGALSAIAFSGISNTITHVEFTTDERLDDAADIKLEIIYAMSSSEVGKSVSLNADIWTFVDNENPAKVADVLAQEDELVTPADGNTEKIVLTNIKIPLANLTGVGQRIKIKLWRDIAGVISNHTGDFQLISMRAYQ